MAEKMKAMGVKGHNLSVITTSRKSVIVGVLGTICLVLCRVSSYIQNHDEHMTSTTRIRPRASVKDMGLAKEDGTIGNSTVLEATADVKRLIGTKKGTELGSSDIEVEENDEEIDFSIEVDHEPYLGRWQRRFAASEARNKKGGYLFLKHIRKAGGTSVRTYLREVLGYYNITREANDFRGEKNPKSDDYRIHYIEQEFQAMDSQCPSLDPRWQDSLQIIVFRHPIERHLSEFFFSGSGLKYPIDSQQLYTNKSYTDGLALFLEENVSKWMTLTARMNGESGDHMKGKFNGIFGRSYTDNFQLRALAGCSSGECLQGKEVTTEHMDKINNFHPSSYSYSDPVPRCTNFWRREDSTNLLEICAKGQNIKEECATVGCDGPCFYPTVSWGELGSEDVTRAVSALKAFDAVLLMEKLDSQDQSDFLSDILGVPRDAEFSLASRGSALNAGVEKTTKRDKTHFYRDLLLNLGLKNLKRKLYAENKLEIEFFNHAERLNNIMIDQWKRERLDA